MENEKESKFTLEHAQIFFQTLADIVGEKYNVEIIAKVKEKWKEVINMFSVALAILCFLSIGLALEKDKENGR